MEYGKDLYKLSAWNRVQDRSHKAVFQPEIAAVILASATDNFCTL